MFKCHNCGKVFASLTQDGCCDNAECFGEPLMAMVEPAAGQFALVVAPQAGTVEGLCVLVCDISGSMDAAAFANHPAEKLKLTAGMISRAISELQSLAKAHTAYIAIVAFGARAGIIDDKNGKPFVKSVDEIMSEYGENAAALPTYLYSYFKEDTGGFGRDHTDISAALTVARNIYDTTLVGDLTPLGINASARLIDHSDIVTESGRQISMPNIRVMIYSDGGHNPENGAALTNAFEDLSPSPLMTAFIGNEQADASTLAGADQMKAIANICPEHGQKGYFLINTPERYAVLRGLFRMASGASGFCPQCLRRQFASLESPSAA
jgi:hypothetical protein